MYRSLKSHQHESTGMRLHLEFKVVCLEYKVFVGKNCVLTGSSVILSVFIFDLLTLLYWNQTILSFTLLVINIIRQKKGQGNLSRTKQEKTSNPISGPSLNFLHVTVLLTFSEFFVFLSFPKFRRHQIDFLILRSSSGPEFRLKIVYDRLTGTRLLN